MYRKPVEREKDHQDFHLVFCRAELFALHQALSVLNPGDKVQQALRTHIQNLLYPASVTW